ncbi:hypothetical protein AB0K23_30770, partial [Streptomyces sp. NPDC049602]
MSPPGHTRRSPGRGGQAVVTLGHRTGRPPSGPADWIKANVAGFRELLTPLLGKMQDRRSTTPGSA